jgi:sugar transferase (PEP-CTERM/EpsH1 system associated)
MNLLFVAPRLPYPPTRGGEITVYNFIKHLADRHAISLVSFYDHEEELSHRPHLEKYCTRIELVRRRTKYSPAVFFEVALRGKSYGWARHYSSDFWRVCRQLILEEKIDLVQVETYLMAQYQSSFLRRPVVLDMHNTTWLIWERMQKTLSFPFNVFAAVDGRREKRDELAACHDADISLAVSEVDKELLLAETGGETHAEVVAPGVDTDFLKPEWDLVPKPRLIFVGSMEYVPNIDAMEYFCLEILPLIMKEMPEVSLTIVGKPTPALQRLGNLPNVNLAGFMDDVRGAIRESAVSIVPLRIGGGIRLKILEAMALGSAIVSTSIGCEGLDLTNEQELLVADSPQDFAAAVIRLLRDSPLSLKLRRRAREVAESRFSWEQSVARLEAVYSQVLSRAGVATAVGKNG